MAQPAPRPDPTPEPASGAPGSVVDPADHEAWRDLQAVLEERDREWWAGDPDAWDGRDADE